MALYFFHNAKESLNQNTGPYFYLPKLESHLEARLWNDVFNFAQDALDVPRGTIKATVLIETILAAFEAEEILYELRDHSSGLNCGRWDYIFSYIKKFRNKPEYLLPDRAQVTMTKRSSLLCLPPNGSPMYRNECWRHPPYAVRPFSHASEINFTKPYQRQTSIFKSCDVFETNDL